LKNHGLLLKSSNDNSLNLNAFQVIKSLCDFIQCPTANLKKLTKKSGQFLGGLTRYFTDFILSAHPAIAGE